MIGKEKLNQGKIYVCGTPIGNLKDITLRVLDIFQQVDLIAAEDTRRTSKLLNKYDINTSLTSYHEHNEKEKSNKLLKKIKKGLKLALVSDAGMPGISDPGFEIINKAVENEIEVTPVPGPTALIPALVVSGLPMDRFTFQGFIPRKGDAREERLKAIKKSEITNILYESPYRVLDTLKDLNKILENRKVTVVRELTKVHEEKIYGTISKVIDKLSSRDI